MTNTLINPVEQPILPPDSAEHSRSARRSLRYSLMAFGVATAEGVFAVDSITNLDSDLFSIDRSIFASIQILASAGFLCMAAHFGRNAYLSLRQTQSLTCSSVSPLSALEIIRNQKPVVGSPGIQ